MWFIPQFPTINFKGAIEALVVRVSPSTNTLNIHCCSSCYSGGSNEGRRTMASFPRIPINPRLIFGESIEKVCTRGRLHPGLKELFTKAYFSAHPNECLIHDDGELEGNNNTSPGAWILTILKFAQGDVAVRLSLKKRLETGRWLMPLQVPPAAPLWLIRHFLGRLHTPLLFCPNNGTCEYEEFKKRWILLSKECHTAVNYQAFNQKLHFLIQTKFAAAMDDMQLEACLIFISLITLIRNLSYEPTRGWIDKYAVQVLVDYFVPALVSRPYRPGYLTKEDKESRTGLCYLCHNLSEIQALCKRPETCNNVHLIFDSASGTSILELHKMKGTSPIVRKTIPEDLKTPLSKTESLNSEKLCESKRISTEVKKVLSEDMKTPLFKTESLGSEKLLENRGTSTTMNQVISENLKSPFTNTGSPPSEYLQASTFPKKTKEEPKKELQREYVQASSSTILEARNGEEDKGTQTDSLFSEHLEEKEIVTNLKSIQRSNSEDSLKVLPIKYEEPAENAADDVMEYTAQNDKITINCSPVKKCQAVKLAYKLRGQWLAWKLAGLFLDGATSHISGLGYTKLSHDASYLIN